MRVDPRRRCKSCALFFFSQRVVSLLLRINLLKGFGVLSAGLEEKLELEDKTRLYLGMYHF